MVTTKYKTFARGYGFELVLKKSCETLWFHVTYPVASSNDASVGNHLLCIFGSVWDGFRSGMRPFYITEQDLLHLTCPVWKTERAAFYTINAMSESGSGIV